MRCKDGLLEIFIPHLSRLKISLARQIWIVCEGFAGVGELLHDYCAAGILRTYPKNRGMSISGP